MRTSILALLALILAACAGAPTGPQAGEVPLTKDEIIANHTNTAIKGKMGNGDRFESAFAADHTVKSTYRSNGGSESDEGQWSLSDSDGETICLTWKKWEKSCWNDYKAGDAYVSYEQGGKKRRASFTVTPN